MKQAAINQLQGTEGSVELRRRAAFVSLGLLLALLALSGGCGVGIGEEDNPVSSTAAAEMLVDESPATESPATESPEAEVAVLFDGTNLLEGVWEELRRQENLEPADNSYCYVCHANYQTEVLTQTHLPMGVGCELCHGMSDEHSADEDGLTPPEIMWPAAWINLTCMECHPSAELARNVSHRDFLTRPEPGETCMHCHGEEHRLNVRTRIWDRKTGELLECDGVRMMDEDSPAGAAF